MQDNLLGVAAGHTRGSRNSAVQASRRAVCFTPQPRLYTQASQGKCERGFAG